ncbi:hypothetical protein [Rubrivirga sp. IMCC45206]|uniref:hypothetical protein n=1 Tax=Rubrivirga sp. IMCC45206 TaxID=3391614 RepID=UPI0039900F60
MRRPLLLLALLAFATGAADAQVGFGLFNGRNHAELDWQVATTEHFEIIYPARLAGIEAEAAAVAEATFDALTVTFSPDSTALAFSDPIRIYLSDEDEIANGIAFNVGSSGFTTIWVHVNDTAEIWTGDVKWLRKVIAHEVAHLIHYRAIRSNLGLLDVFFADPLPSFWAEGLAQYATERWDAQRGDRWLRTATFEDRLSYTDGSSPQNGRLRYAVGNSQVRFLAQSRGDSTIAQILAHRKPVLFGLGRAHDFETAFRAVTGEPFRDFSEEWRKHVNVYYNTQAGQMERLDSLATKPFGLPGQVVYEVAFSPDTARVAAVVLPSLARPVRRLIAMTNPGADSTGANLRILAEGAITGPITWSPDGAQIAFARTRRGAYGSLVNDLYLVRSSGGGLRRLTTDRRAVSPSFAPDGRRLAFVGVEGATANLFELDLDTGAERALTAFTGDVQIPTARWSPDGARVVFSLFDGEGTRDLAVLDLASGTVERLATGAGVPRAERDDRLPVWNAAGDSLAFTSLRDRAPNVFVAGVDGGALVPTLVPAELPPPGGEARVTFLFDGATVHDWLPPDSLHPAGRLVLVSSETKRRDRVFVVDARRRPTVTTDSVTVPPAYAAWTTHRPPITIPDAIAPDPALVRERRRYHALANLTHAITLGLPYGDPGEDGELFTDDDDWGVFANSLFLEPLGKHQLAILAGVSVTRPVDKSFGLVSYTNRQTPAALTLDLYRFTSPSTVYGSRLLVEDLLGGDLSATLPVDVIDRPYTATLLGARVRYAYAEPLALDRFVDVAAQGLGVPEAGTRFDVEIGAAYKFQRPYRWNVIAPLDGTGLRARVAVGIPALGGDAFVRPDVLGYRVWPVFGQTRLFTKARATAVFGETLAQDYVGLARYDAIDAALPFVGALEFAGAERVRGYRSYAVGTRALFGSAELRGPALGDLQTTLLGLVELGPVSPAAFVDAGLVWTGADLDGAIERVGVGGELANVLRIAGLEIRHAVGLASPADRLGDLVDGTLPFDDLDLYYRVQAAVPF